MALLVALFALDHAAIADRLSTLERPLIAAMVKTYLRIAAERQGMSRIKFEAQLQQETK